MQFFYIECNRVQQDFCEYPLRSSASQTSEVPILFQHPEGSFRLDRPVDSQQDALLAVDRSREAARAASNAQLTWIVLFSFALVQWALYGQLVHPSV